MHGFVTPVAHKSPFSGLGLLRTGGRACNGRHSNGKYPGLTVESAVADRRVNNPNTYLGESTMKYEKPVVQRFGSLRELTLGNGPRLGGDAVSLYHRS